MSFWGILGSLRGYSIRSLDWNSSFKASRPNSRTAAQGARYAKFRRAPEFAEFRARRISAPRGYPPRGVLLGARRSFPQLLPDLWKTPLPSSCSPTAACRNVQMNVAPNIASHAGGCAGMKIQTFSASNWEFHRANEFVYAYHRSSRSC